MTTSHARSAGRGLKSGVNGSPSAPDGREAGNEATPRVDVLALERRFTELTHLLYDTSVPAAELQEKVYPYLAPDIEFRDPWVKASGRQHFWIGLKGFHAVIRFKFEISQLTVQLDERGDRGRVLVDGVMALNQLVVYTYPLRTQLVYEFTISPDGERLQITTLEEMWSLGDLIENIPGLSRPYEVYRRCFGYLFGGMFWIAATAEDLRTRAAASKKPATA